MTELNWWTLASKHWGKIIGGLLGLIFAILVISLRSFWWAVFIYFCVAAGLYIGWRLDVNKNLRSWFERVFSSSRDQ